MRRTIMDHACVFLWNFNPKKSGKWHLVRKAVEKTQSSNQQNGWSELDWLLAAASACVINLTALGQHL